MKIIVLISFNKYSRIIALMVTIIVDSPIKVLVALIAGDANVCRRNKKETTGRNVNRIITLTMEETIYIYV